MPPVTFPLTLLFWFCFFLLSLYGLYKTKNVKEEDEEEEDKKKTRYDIILATVVVVFAMAFIFMNDELRKKIGFLNNKASKN
jgi:preprotein translocase subunit SecG